MRILGISHLEPFTTYYHDTNIGWVEDGVPTFAALEERYSRLKHHAGYPSGALAALKRRLQAGMADADLLVVPERRHLGDPEAMITNSAPHHFALSTLARPLKLKCDVWHCDHQLAHASVAFRFSPFDEALVVVLDGMGHDAGRPCFGGAFLGHANTLERVKTCWSDGNSLGLFYGMVTEALGWPMSDGEGKTMALSANGDLTILRDRLAEFAPHAAGTELTGGRRFAPHSIVANNRHFVFDPAIAELRTMAESFGRENLAAAAQSILEQTVEQWIAALLKAYPNKNVCLGGGIFMNARLNGHLMRRFPDVSVFIPPSPADGGIAIGAALEAAARNGESRAPIHQPQFLGSDWDRATVDAAIRRQSLVVRQLDDPARAIAQQIAAGKVVGLYQGRSEWGPRALGNRSVLAHPGIAGMRDRINRLMKQRELFMPFAPAMLSESIADWFTDTYASPFMMFTHRVKSDKAHLIGAVLHDDNTARVQTVTAIEYPVLHAVINGFAELTGLPMVLNTSFNIHGEPMVESPDDAIRHLLMGCVDCLVIDDLLVERD